MVFTALSRSQGKVAVTDAKEVAMEETKSMLKHCPWLCPAIYEGKVILYNIIMEDINGILQRCLRLNLVR